ncbi:hypothetical protein Btru_072142 [Bulinus truncatus]|nr:hypothetical protein Btru_072142 [Bulinus truncatus]
MFISLPDLSKNANNVEDEAVYADDFEESDSGEDLDQVVAQAREVQTIHPVDDFFVEGEELALSQTLTQMHIFKSQMEAAMSQVTHL